ncbi:hypothetical protein HWB40_gp18 [Streptomyces phage Manuel]|uniref:Uncharacterized protein n=1 Tax=Streptomyces phage Manuel TaxID=2053812 RepID=A0A2H4PR46_9CAUD|nr:hypothetical protein HWB40_gp18 [Streptomyces phage Manuel]ATW69374.1 hypothetical protein SEA_MANUEL_80 [Streptomyces phage Manuel]
MGVKKLDAATVYHNNGDVLVYSESPSSGAVKVLKEVYLSEISEYRYVVQYGQIKDDKFVGDLSYTKHPEIALYTGKEITQSYEYKFVPGIVVQPGDILKDKDGVIYIVQSSDIIWNTRTGTHAGLEYWNGTNWGQKDKQLKQVPTANGSNFSKELKIS